MKSEPPEARRRLAFIDGVRALAAIWVVLGHLCGLQYSPRGGILGAATNWILNPHLAVDVFIVISGFCLILPYAVLSRPLNSATNFYFRRARRILPTFWIACFFSICIAMVVQHFGRTGERDVSIGSVLANILLFGDWLPTMNRINPPFWSVAVEVKIYLFFPFFLAAIRRFGAATTVSAVAVLAYSLTLGIRYAAPTYSLFNTCPWYLLLFAMGAAAGHYSSRPARYQETAAWLILIGATSFSVILFWHHPMTPLSQTEIQRAAPVADGAAGAVTSAILLLISRGAGDRVRRLLEAPALVSIGTKSYSLYLTHLPCLVVVRAIVIRLLPSDSSAAVRLLSIAAIGLPVVGSTCWAFFAFFERPFLTGASRREVDRNALERRALSGTAPNF